MSFQTSLLCHEPNERKSYWWENDKSWTFCKIQSKMFFLEIFTIFSFFVNPTFMLQSKLSSQFYPYQVGKLHKMGQNKLFYCNCETWPSIESKSDFCGLICPPPTSILCLHAWHGRVKMARKNSTNSKELSSLNILLKL